MRVKGRRRGRATALRALAAWGALAAGSGRARAHPELSALGTNRTVTVAIFDGRVDVTDALLEGALVSGDERRRLDADGDGRISDAEVRAGEERLRAEGAALTLEVDGRAVSAPLVVAIDLGDEPGATDAPLVVERRLSCPGAWADGARRLRVVLTREPPRPLDTEIGVVLGPGFALASGVDLVTFRGARASTLEQRAATFDIIGPPPRRRGKALITAGLGVTGVLAIFFLRRRRPRRS